MKQRIVVFSLLDTPAFGGAEQYMFSHLSFLHKVGYEIVLATNNESVKKEILSRLTIDEKDTFRVVRVPYRLDAIGNWKGLVKFFLSLPKAVLWCFLTLRTLKENYERVICLWPGFSDRLVFSPIARFFKLPILWVEIGPLEPSFKKNFGLPKLLYRLSELFPTHIITTSLYTKKSIINNTHFTSSDITLVYPGVRLFSPKELTDFKKKAEEWRKHTKLNKKTLISVIARLAHENEIAMVIKAFSLFVKRYPRDVSELVIIGDGPIRQDLEDLTISLQLSRRIRFTGFISEDGKRTILSASNFFIFPRAWDLDGFGMTTIEAMAFGLPVLTTDYGPQIEIVTNGQEGFRYKPHNSEDLALHIKKMIDTKPQFIMSMRRYALSRVEAFSEAKSHKALYSVIRTLHT